MKIKIQYFGLIADKIGYSIEEFLIPTSSENVNVRNLLISRYPILAGLTYKIAINSELKEEITPLVSDVNIAVLPPFAGG
jgi:sulfur-carrier protein